MKRRGMALVAATGLLASCAPSLTQPPVASRVAAPLQWRTQLGSDAAIEADWWKAFGDPQLSELVELARANNTDVAIAAARVREARAQEQASRALLLPSLDFTGQGAESRSLSPFGKPVESLVLQPVFQASYELDLFGKNRAQIDAAQANAGAAQALSLIHI